MRIRSDGVVERLKRVRPTLPVLPDEIVLEILVRLPVKSLLQFKRVCKSWRTLISSPQFAIDNLRQRSSSERHDLSRLVYYNKYYHYSRIGFLTLQPFLKDQTDPTDVISFFDMRLRFKNIGKDILLKELVIRGSCNGLLCLHHLPSHRFWLWNPCLRSSSKHCFPIKHPSSLTYFGLGYDHVHDKYKLVTAHGQDSTRIFRFGPNYWTFGPDFPYPAVGISGKIGKYLSGTGTLNWMASMKEKEWVILSFDVANETFGQVSLPRLSGVDLYTYDPVLQVSMNYLSFTIQKDTVFEMWMMKEYGVWESWIMITRVNLVFGSYPFYIPLSISERDALLLLHPYHNLVLYDCDDREFYHLRIGDTPIEVIKTPKTCYSGDFFPTYFVYHDSLVFPP